VRLWSGDAGHEGVHSAAEVIAVDTPYLHVDQDRRSALRSDAERRPKLHMPVLAPAGCRCRAKCPVSSSTRRRPYSFRSGGRYTP
jgi:hypothetical protein